MVATLLFAVLATSAGLEQQRRLQSTNLVFINDFLGRLSVSIPDPSPYSVPLIVLTGTFTATNIVCSMTANERGRCAGAANHILFSMLGRAGGLRISSADISASPVDQELNPAEGQRSYSSVHSNDAIGTGHARSTLDSAQAWSAAASTAGQYMTIDAGSLVDMVGVVTQGRANHDQWVTSYQVLVSVDGTTFTAIDGGATFRGNGDRSTRVNSFFSAPTPARYARIVVQSWNGFISMRAALLVQPSAFDVPIPLTGVELSCTGSYTFSYPDSGCFWGMCAISASQNSGTLTVSTATPGSLDIVLRVQPFDRQPSPPQPPSPPGPTPPSFALASASMSRSATGD
jgi:hypothetical protein